MAYNLFITAVYDYSVTRGLWSKVGTLPLEEKLLITPSQFAQNLLNPVQFYIIENGIRRSATKEECKGLERSAVWTPEGIQNRLNDHYAGRKNFYLEKDKNLESPRPLEKRKKWQFNSYLFFTTYFSCTQHLAKTTQFCTSKNLLNIE